MKMGMVPNGLISVKKEVKASMAVFRTMSMCKFEEVKLPFSGRHPGFLKWGIYRIGMTYGLKAFYSKRKNM